MIWEAPALEAKAAAARIERTSGSRRMRHASSAPFRCCSEIPRTVSLAQFLGQETKRVEPPGKVEVCCEEEHGVPRSREVAREEGKLVEPRGELRAAFVAVQLDGERLHSPVVDAELAVRVATRGEEE